jgi:hypothetical protein
MRVPTTRPRAGLFGLRIPFIELLGIRSEHWERGRALVGTFEVKRRGGGGERGA